MKTDTTEEENQVAMLLAIVITLVLAGFGFLIAVASIYQAYNHKP